MKMSKKTVACFLALVMTFSCAVPAFAAENGETAGNVQVTKLDSAPRQDRGVSSTGTQAQQTSAYRADERVRAIVIMEDEPTVSANPGFSLFGLRPAPTESDLLETHEELREEMSDEGIGYELNYDYTTLLNGMSVTVEYGDLDAIAGLPGVASVHVANTYVRIDGEEEGAQQSGGEQQMANANELTGVSSLLANNYNGAGMVIAVLDSGITPEHEVFNTMPQAPVIEKDTAAALIKELGHGIYLSDKIPYYHDYYEDLVNEKNNTPDVKAEFEYDAGGHGTHVAGIAAGYAVDEEGGVVFSGAAPQAQILAMKIFADDVSNGSTTTDLCFAALEDAYKLGADVINMSIGWYYGFTYDNDLEEVLQNIYAKLETNGVIVCASAGNYYSVGDWNGYLEEGWTYSDYVDYGTICAPATYPGTLAVAAAENSAYVADTVLQAGDDYVLYTDNTAADNCEDGYTFSDFVDSLTDRTVDYVVVPNLGYKSDYAGLDVTDKVVLVQRGADPNINNGSFRFAEKIQIAADQGAAAVIICNNVSGDISMDLSPDLYAVPAVSISQESFNEYFYGTESGTITFPAGSVEIENSDAGRMVDMSSWGATPSLTIGPEIAAVGGHVRSALGYTEDEYVVYSGTSMASPNMAGAMTTLLQYLKDQGYTNKAERASAAKSLVESTAMILDNDIGYPYSPRKQGAGLYNIRKAIASDAYIVEPLCNLYDDPQRTGEFNIRFTIQNMTDEKQTYTIDSVDVLYDYVWYDYDYNIGYNYITADFVGYYDNDGYWTPGYTITAPDNVVVPAGETADVTVTVQLSDAWMEYFNTVFPNGNYVEGFVRLTNAETWEMLHATYMGFYGDWTDAPVMEQYDWRDSYYYRDYESTFATASGTPILNYAYLEDISSWSAWVDGGDNYFQYWYSDYDYTDWNYEEDRFAINPYGYYLNGLYVEPVNIRNARYLVMVVSDADTGEVYCVDSQEYLIKPIYDYTYDWWYLDEDAWFSYDGTDSEGRVLDDGTKLTVSFYASIDYGEDVLSTVNWTTADLSEYKDYLGWTFSCVIDTEPPELDVNDQGKYDVVYDPETGTLTVSAADNQYLAHASVYGYNDQNKWTLIDYALFYGSKGESNTAVFDVNGYSGVYLYLDDYATNESWYWIDLVAYHDHTELKHMEYADPTCTEDGHYEYWYCEECGGYFWDEDGLYVAYPDEIVIPALGHDWGEWKTVTEPTDFTNGLEERTCSVCGETETRIIPALDHVHRLIYVEAQDAACEEDGSTAYWYCEDCGAYFLNEDDAYGVPASVVVIPALGHDWSEWEVDAENGVKTRVCYNCGETETIAIPPEEIEPEALIHVEAETAACEKPGNTEYWRLETEDGTLYFADENGETQISESDTIIPALGHTWGSWEIIRKATINEEGLRVRVCSVCGEKEEYTIPRLPHTHQLTHTAAKDASCEENGNIEYWYCEQCGKYFSDADAENEITEAETVLKAHGHDTYLKGYKLPTSRLPGYSGDLVCRICGKVIEKGYVIDPIGEPSVPTPPTRPTQPAQPTEPTGPAKPAEPVAPVEPAKPTTPTAPADSVSFADVNAGSWYYADVQYVCEKGLMNGVDDTHFSPETDLTRSMIATILHRMEDKPSVRYTGAFPDVADGMWYTEPVEWAALNSIVTGYSNGKFGPDDFVTREQLAAILYRYAQYKGYDVTGGADLSAYADSAGISAYALTAMRWAVAEGLLNGVDGKLLPQEYASRAEVAAIIRRFLETR